MRRRPLLSLNLLLFALHGVAMAMPPGSPTVVPNSAAVSAIVLSEAQRSTIADLRCIVSFAPDARTSTASAPMTRLPNDDSQWLNLVDMFRQKAAVLYDALVSRYEAMESGDADAIPAESFERFMRAALQTAFQRDTLAALKSQIIADRGLAPVVVSLTYQAASTLPELLDQVELMSLELDRLFEKLEVPTRAATEADVAGDRGSQREVRADMIRSLRCVAGRVEQSWSSAGSSEAPPELLAALPVQPGDLLHYAYALDVFRSHWDSLMWWDELGPDYAIPAGRDGALMRPRLQYLERVTGVVQTLITDGDSHGLHNEERPDYWYAHPKDMKRVLSDGAYVARRMVSLLSGPVPEGPLVRPPRVAP